MHTSTKMPMLSPTYFEAEYNGDLPAQDTAFHARVTHFARCAENLANYLATHDMESAHRAILEQVLQVLYLKDPVAMQFGYRNMFSVAAVLFNFHTHALDVSEGECERLLREVHKEMRGSSEATDENKTNAGVIVSSYSKDDYTLGIFQLVNDIINYANRHRGKNSRSQLQ